MTRDERIAIGLGGVNGFLLSVAIAATTLDANASWRLAAIVLVLGLVATSRGAAYVRRCLQRRASLARPARDGFVLLFLAAVAYVVPGLLAAYAGDAAGGTGWWPLWRDIAAMTLRSGLVAGLFGALAGLVLGGLSAVVALWFRPIDPAFERLRKRHKTVPA